MATRAPDRPRPLLAAGLPRDRPRRRPLRPVLFVPALIGTAVLLLVAGKGAYASPDSAFYLGVARNLLDGLGLVAPPGSPPLPHFPPLFPMALAATGRLLGLGPLDAAAVLNPVLLGLTALLVTLVVRRRSGSDALGVTGGVLVVVSLDLLVYGASALSEPLFVVLVLASLVALASAVETGRSHLVALAAVLAGGAAVTRYAGVALIVAGAASLAYLERGRGRWKATVFLVVSGLPLAAWMAAAGRSPRSLDLHLFDLEYWALGIGSLSRWVLPPFVPWPLRVAALAGVAVRVRRTAVLHRRPAGARHRRQGPLPFLLGAFAVAYLGLLVTDRLVLDASGRLDGRFLGPLHVMAILGGLPFLHRVMTVPARQALAGTPRRAVAGAMALLALQGLQAGAWAVKGLTDESIDRRGLSARPWRESAVLAAVEALPDGVPVYSNAPDAVFMLTGRRTSPLPPYRHYLTGDPEPAHARHLAHMAQRLARGDGRVAYFTAFEHRERFLPSVAELSTALALETETSDGIGVLYRPAPGPG